MLDDLDGLEDFDLDGIPNGMDLDVDGDGVSDTFEFHALADHGVGTASLADFDFDFADGHGLPNVPLLEYLRRLRLHNPFGDIADGNLIEIDGYVRTIADGIEENNLSYRGADGIGPSPDLEDVATHVRTPPDGIEENNRSFGR